MTLSGMVGRGVVSQLGGLYPVGDGGGENITDMHTQTDQVGEGGGISTLQYVLVN